MILDQIIRYKHSKPSSKLSTNTLEYLVLLPAYSTCQGLGILKQKFPTTPVLALTATATASVKEDVVQALGLENCVIFRQSFNRPNLW